MFRLVMLVLLTTFLLSCGHTELAVRSPSLAPAYPEIKHRDELVAIGDYLQIDWNQTPARVALVVHPVESVGARCCGSSLDLMPEQFGNRVRYRVPDNVAANFTELWINSTLRSLFAVRETPPDTRMAFRLYKVKLFEFTEQRMPPLYRVDFRHAFSCSGSGCS